MTTTSDPQLALGHRRLAIGSARRAAIPAVVGAALWLLGRPTGALVAGGVSIVLVVVGLAIPGALRRVDDLVRRFAEAVSRTLGLGLAALAWVLIVLPTWALSKLVGYSPLDLGWESPDTAWVQVNRSRSQRPNGEPVDARRLGFVDTPFARGARLRGLVRLVPVVALGLVAWQVAGPSAPTTTATRSAIDLSGAQTGRPVTGMADLVDGQIEFGGLPVDDYAHENEPWATDLIREIQSEYSLHDYTLGVRLRDYSGRYLNIEDGRRVTYEPQEPVGTVWFFGGSTGFGIGQRDEHTIPSVLSRLAENDGTPVRILNFAVPGDTNWNETIRLAESLTSPLDRPGLIVFYDGCNEFASGWQRLDDNNLDPLTIERLVANEAERELHRTSHDAPESTPDQAESADLVVSVVGAQYGRGVEFGRRLAQGYDIPVVHIWQPLPFAKKPSTADDGLYERLGFDPDLLPTVTGWYAQIRELSGADPIDLSTALDDTDAPVYFDGCHNNEYGARLIAERLYSEIGDQLPT